MSITHQRFHQGIEGHGPTSQHLGASLSHFSTSLIKLMVALHAVTVVHIFQPKKYTVLIKTGDAVNHYVRN